MWPSRRCCSTEAGSVSACVTMMRRSALRCSPGTSCQAGAPTADLRLGRVARVQEDAPAIVGHAHVLVVSPAAGVDADGRAQVHGLVGEVAGAHVVPPLEVVGQPLLERASQLGVVREADVVGDLRVEIDRGACRHGFPGVVGWLPKRGS